MTISNNGLSDKYITSFSINCNGERHRISISKRGRIILHDHNLKSLLLYAKTSTAISFKKCPIKCLRFFVAYILESSRFTACPFKDRLNLVDVLSALPYKFKPEINALIRQNREKTFNRFTVKILCLNPKI